MSGNLADRMNLSAYSEESEVLSDRNLLDQIDNKEDEKKEDSKENILNSEESLQGQESEKFNTLDPRSNLTRRVRFQTTESGDSDDRVQRRECLYN